MARRRAADVLDELRAASTDAPAEETEVVDAPEVEERARKPRAVDAATAALFDVDPAQVPDVVTAAVRAWREVNDREVPSVDRLAAPGVTERVDVDAASGYVAVVTRDDTWRAFLPREQVAPVVALLLRRPAAEVARELAAGPTKLTPAQRP